LEIAPVPEARRLAVDVRRLAVPAAESVRQAQRAPGDEIQDGGGEAGDQACDQLFRLAILERHLRGVERVHDGHGQERSADREDRVGVAVDPLDGVEVIRRQRRGALVEVRVALAQMLRAVGIDQRESKEVMTPRKWVAATTRSAATGIAARPIRLMPPPPARSRAGQE
jgi:hypothetical protein